MASVVKKGSQYIRHYELVNGHFNFKWTRDLNAALPMNDQFASYIGRVSSGKTIPIVEPDKAKPKAKR